MGRTNVERLDGPFALANGKIGSTSGVERDPKNCFGKPGGLSFAKELARALTAWTEHGDAKLTDLLVTLAEPQHALHQHPIDARRCTGAPFRQRLNVDLVVQIRRLVPGDVSKGRGKRTFMHGFRTA